MSILKKFRKSIMFIIKIMLVLMTTFIFIESWQSNYYDALFSSKGNYVVVFSYLIILIVFGILYGAFKIGTLRLHEVVYGFTLSMVFANFIMYLELSLIARTMLNPVPILFSMILQFSVILFGCYAANIIYYSFYSARQIIAISEPNMKCSAIITKMKKIKERYEIKKIITTNTDLNEILSQIDNYEAVLIGDIEKSLQDKILKYCYSHKKRIYILPTSNDIIVNSCEQRQIFDTPLLVCRNRGLTIEQEIMKRAMDIFLSLTGIVLTGPVMLVLAVIIKAYDKGPVFFKQNRVTKNGKIFNVLKFRSMIVDADKVKLRRAVENDDRITPIGKFMRPCRLDELPQLINILKGDMSFVGPRPERTENVYEYTQTLPEFDLRHRVKSGLTGYAQIYGKYNTSPQDKLNMDLIYIEKYSLLLDIKLIVMTIKILAMRESTEGFAAEESEIKLVDKPDKQNSLEDIKNEQF